MSGVFFVITVRMFYQYLRQLMSNRRMCDNHVRSYHFLTPLVRVLLPKYQEKKTYSRNKANRTNTVRFNNELLPKFAF